MSIEDVIKRTGNQPATVSSLTADFAALGIEPGTVLLVHTSLSSLGWVCGGAVAVIEALKQALGTDGTLVMPAHSADLSDPVTWENPPVPRAWWDTIRKEMPPYDARLTPTCSIGVVPELFRCQPGVLRSDHPLLSFCAWGAKAATIINDHSMDFGLGEQSPLARLYDLDGQVLMLGVGYPTNTSLHLAEYRALYPGCPVIETSVPMLTNGIRERMTIRDMDKDVADFEALGTAYEKDDGCVCRGQVACATAKLMPQRALVDYATRWLVENRSEGNRGR